MWLKLKFLDFVPYLTQFCNTNWNRKTLILKKFKISRQFILLIVLFDLIIIKIFYYFVFKRLNINFDF